MSNQEKQKVTVGDYVLAGAAVTPILLLGGWIPLGLAAVCVGSAHVAAHTVMAVDNGIRRAVGKPHKTTR